MNINLTLLAQALTFAIFIWFTAKFVWPPLMRAVDERQQKIAEGLAAAEAGMKDFAEAKARAEDVVREARGQAAQIVDQAQRRANEIVNQAKGIAVNEGERLLAQAKQQIEIEQARAREELRKEAAALVAAGVAKVLEREIDASKHSDLIDKLTAELRT